MWGSINMGINSMPILQQWSNNRMIIDRYIINQRINSGYTSMNKVMLEYGVWSNYWLEGQGRLGVVESHLKVCVVSKSWVSRVYWINRILHRLVCRYKLYILIWVESWGKDRIGILLNIVIESKARSKGNRGCSIRI
ncbi:hypothetical protein HanIR_Chr04g0155921 [Helianthus annuus]|nr:hypothetical protein HanIR_Chr04g0155921 [Helianthus annuus]